MRRKWVVYLLLLLLTPLVLCTLLLFVLEPEYAYMPSREHILNQSRHTLPAFDLWGQDISQEEAQRLSQTPRSLIQLSPANGAVAIDEALLRLGREVFYRETFGNEVFLSDIMGILDGPFTAWHMAKALLQLRGKGTTNLQVELVHTVRIGGKIFPQGTKINTGLDVPPGVYIPVGIKVKFARGRLMAGITCAVCHAALDPESNRLVEGAKNPDFNAGVILALASNTAAYFTHTGIASLTPFLTDPSRVVVDATGQAVSLPEPHALEDAVDATLLRWPPGTFDATIDLASNPTQFADTFTLGGHPYSWTGFGAAGPFKGLSALSNNVHAIGSDAVALAKVSPALFGIDTEVYLGTVLQNAARGRYRFHPGRGQKPSVFFASVDPTPGAPGVNALVALPTYPNASAIAVTGLIGSTPGYRVWEQNNAVAAFQNTLVPPDPKTAVEPTILAQGRDVFERAGCATCHAGATLTNHPVIPAPEIGTDPSRAKALQGTEKIFVPALLYAFDTPVPVPPGARVLTVPTAPLDPQQFQLSWAHGDSPGGYKVPSFIGLYWTAPYLHDGGVAVGLDLERHVGLPGTLLQGIPVDPVNSLRALIDGALRQRVIAANQTSSDLRAVHVQGIGHAFWVDPSTGFTPAEQEALLQYLLFGKLRPEPYKRLP